VDAALTLVPFCGVFFLWPSPSLSRRRRQSRGGLPWTEEDSGLKRGTSWPIVRPNPPKCSLGVTRDRTRRPWMKQPFPG